MRDATKSKPIELANTSAATETAWDIYDAAIDNDDFVTKQAAWQAIDILDEIRASQYAQWQILGGTSDIESLALYGLEMCAELDGCRTDTDLYDYSRGR